MLTNRLLLDLHNLLKTIGNEVFNNALPTKPTLLLLIERRLRFITNRLFEITKN
jgi:hypothetical protein